MQICMSYFEKCVQEQTEEAITQTPTTRKRNVGLKWHKAKPLHSHLG